MAESVLNVSEYAFSTVNMSETSKIKHSELSLFFINRQQKKITFKAT